MVVVACTGLTPLLLCLAPWDVSTPSLLQSATKSIRSSSPGTALRLVNRACCDAVLSPPPFFFLCLLLPVQGSCHVPVEMRLWDLGRPKRMQPGMKGSLVMTD